MALYKFCIIIILLLRNRK